MDAYTEIMCHNQKFLSGQSSTYEEVMKDSGRRFNRYYSAINSKQDILLDSAKFRAITDLKGKGVVK